MNRSATQVRYDLLADARVYGGRVAELSRGHRGAITGTLNRALGGDENRRLALSWLFRSFPNPKFSSANLQKGEWFALDRWIGSWHDDSGWNVSQDFYREAYRVMSQSLRAYASSLYHVDENGLVANGASLPGDKVIKNVTG